MVLSTCRQRVVKLQVSGLAAADAFRDVLYQRRRICFKSLASALKIFSWEFCTSGDQCLLPMPYERFIIWSKICTGSVQITVKQECQP